MRLFRRAKANASEADWKQYKQCRNHYNAELIKRKQEYINMMHRVDVCLLSVFDFSIVMIATSLVLFAVRF